MEIKEYRCLPIPASRPLEYVTIMLSAEEIGYIKARTKTHCETWTIRGSSTAYYLIQALKEVVL